MEPAFSSWPTGTTEHHSPLDSLKERQKKPRHRHSAYQLAALNQLYERNEHPSLDDRTNLAEKIGMYAALPISCFALSYDSPSIRLRETKTVNAWFQNKRAANKKRSRPGQSPSTYDLPPISSLLSPADSSTATLTEDSSISQVTSPSIPRMPAPSTRINPTPASPEVSKQQTAFYAGNPEHDHTFESSVPVPPSRPRMRMRPSQSQTDELRKAYVTDAHPTKEQREELGRRIGM
jgi:Homeodomain